MISRSASLTRTLSVLTAIISLVIAFSIPAGYFIITYQYIEGSTNAEGTFSARAIEGLVVNNPDSWHFEGIRLQEILHRRLDHNVHETRIIRDMQGQIIAQITEPLLDPVLTFSQPIYDSGTQVARIEIKRSILPLVARTAIVSACSILIGIMIFLILRIFPLRAVGKAYNVLEENEQRLKLALASGHFGVCDWDIVNNVMIWDDRMYEIYGVSRNSVKMVIETWQNGIHPEDRDRVLEDIRTGILEERSYITEFRIVQPDGTVRYIKADGIVIRNTDGKPSRMIGLYDDITERKRAAETLRESEDKYRRLYTSMMDAFVSIDMTGAIIETNNAFNALLNYSSDELRRLTHKDITVEKWHSHESKIVAEQVMVRGFSDVYEKEYHRKDGTIFPVELRTFLITNNNGQPAGMWAIVRDIADRKLVEEERLRAQKLESLGILAGGIAHDFNNLMTVVLGNVQLAMMGLPANHTSYPLLRAALQSTEQTKDLTGRLITFSKGGFPVKQISDVSEVLREVVGKMVKRTGVRVTFDIEKDLCSVAVDENQIRQAFYNLTMNAVEAMPEGGVLTIQVHNTKVQSSDGLPLKEGSYLRIIFADKGTGIVEENLFRIFDPYFTTKGMGANKGVGLGLSVCYSVLKKHDGHIAATSRPGEGTTFTLYLPVLVEKAHKAKTKQTEPFSPNRVLIMEDEIHVRALERAFLERLGYDKVTEAGDGQEAIDRYKEALLLNNPFDLVILDLTVRHGMGGQLAMEELLKEDPSVRVIIASGYVDKPVIEHYKDYGFRGALKKPFSFDEFEEMVKKVIGTEA